MSYTNGLDKPSDYFNTKLYTGTGSSGEKAITGVGFQPDWLWIKNRTVAQEHWLADSVRGTTKFLESNSTNAESSDGATGLASFDSDGFTLGTGSDRTNDLNESMVAWCWLGGGTASSNSNGSITSSVSASTTAGFSIVSYTGTGSSATIGHGLGSIPQWIIVKNRSATDPWMVYHHSVMTASGTNKQFMTMNTNSALQSNSTNTTWESVSTSTFGIGNDYGLNTSSENYIAYCFADVKGYSKFGKYTGNANVDGPMIYTGFRPSYVLIKNAAASEHWRIYDNKRDTFNHMYHVLFANEASAESTVDNASEEIDFLSNGIKIRSSAQQLNGSGQNLVYMAFAESPFVNSSGVPNNGR